jgi:hypothetical protein
MGDSPAAAATISWPESTPTAQASVTIPSWQVTSRLDTYLPHDQRRTHLEGKRTQAHAQAPCTE